MAKVQLVIDLSPELNRDKLTKAASDLRKTLSDAAKDVSIDTRGALEAAKNIDELAGSVRIAHSQARMLGAAFSFNQAIQSIREISNAMGELVAVASQYESKLAAVGAITGITGDALEAIGDRARELAKQFGGSAASQLESFQGILSKLGPQVANNADALAIFGRNVSVLSAASGDNAASSMRAITDTMLQFGLVTGDAMRDAETSTQVINALAASAQVGAAEIPQVAAAIVQAGVAAKGARMDFVEANAAIQVLAVGGKTGSEAGVALRNVLGLLQDASGPAAEAMQRLGTSSKELGRLLTEEGLDAALAKIKSGLDNVGTASERNALMIKIFGAENSAAAGILIDNLDKYNSFVEGIRAGQEGVGSAFEQAAQRMDTSEGIMSRLRATAEDVFISFGQAIGRGALSLIGFGNAIAPTMAALAGIKNVLPVEQISQLALTITSRLVPSLVMSDVATKSLILNKSALSLANIKEAATNAIAIAGKVAQTSATWALTVAQNALNASMLANPIGMIAVAVVAAGAAIYVLYQKFESVREIIDSVLSAIGNAVNYIGDVFGGIGAALGAIFGGAGEDAGEAFSQGFAKSRIERSIEETANKLSGKLKEGIEIKAKVDAESNMPQLLEEYEKLQKRLVELRTKKDNGGLTQAELEEFKKLEKAAEQASKKIQDIAPQTKGAARTIVDEMGNLRIVYDVNIEKAKELSAAQGASGQLAKVQKEYSVELIRQAENIERQIKLQESNLAIINKIEDPNRKQEYIDKYNAENAAIEKNRQALVQSFIEGAKAGLVTGDAIDRMAKVLRISSDEARKMLVAKSLEDAAKTGKLTEEQVAKIADKYGYSRENAIKLYEEQRKNTEEAKRTADAAKNIGDSYDEVKKKLQGNYDYNMKQVVALRQMKAEGKKLTEEQEKQLSQYEQWLAADAAALRQRNTLEAQIADKYGTSAAARTKGAAAGHSAYELAKREFEINKQTAEQARQLAEIKEKDAQLDEGRFETSIEKRERELNSLKLQNVELRRQQQELAKLYEIANREKDSKKRAEYLEELEKLRKRLEIDIASNEYSQKEIILNARIDQDKMKEEIEKIRTDAKRAEIKYYVELGVKRQSELIEYELEQLQKEYSNATAKLRVEIDPKAIAEYKAKLEQISRDMTIKNRELEEQKEQERIELIEDYEERQYRMHVAQAEKAYKQELALAGANERKKLEAFIRLQLEKEQAEQEYLRKRSGLYSAVDKIAQGMRNIDIEETKKKNKDEIKEIERQRRELADKLSKREITIAEYYDRERQLADKAEKLRNKQTAINMKEALRIVSEASREYADRAAQAMLEMAERRNALIVRSYEIEAEIERLKTEMQAAELMKRYELYEEYRNRIEVLERERAAVQAEAAKTTSDVWAKSAELMTANFAMFAAESENLGKALVKSLFATAQAMVPTFIAIIFGKSIASLGPIAGPIAAAALTATLYGLLAAARSAAGYKKGGYTGDGHPDEVAGVVHRGEYVMNAAITAKNYKAFQEIDKGGLTVERWYELKYADRIKQRISEEASMMANQAMIAYIMSEQARNREVVKAIESNTEKLDILAQEVKKGNYIRKTKVEYDIDIKLDRDKMIEAIHYDRYKQLMRG